MDKIFEMCCETFDKAVNRFNKLTDELRSPDTSLERRKAILDERDYLLDVERDMLNITGYICDEELKKDSQTERAQA